jgi:hypothetical protein
MYIAVSSTLVYAGSRWKKGASKSCMYIWDVDLDGRDRNRANLVRLEPLDSLWSWRK